MAAIVGDSVNCEAPMCHDLIPMCPRASSMASSSDPPTLSYEAALQSTLSDDEQGSLGSPPDVQEGLLALPQSLPASSPSLGPLLSVIDQLPTSVQPPPSVSMSQYAWNRGSELSLVRIQYNPEATSQSGDAVYAMHDSSSGPIAGFNAPPSSSSRWPTT